MRVKNLLTFLFFLTFAVFLLLSNDYDWDQFQTMIEVDRRAWVNDFVPPLWSYQYCGGATRLGDPQSFGLSPLFIIPLLFGSLIGSKMLILFCAFMGFVYCRRLLRLIMGNDQDHLSTSFSLFFIFGNFFLWHFHAGHVTFSLIYLCIPIVYYFALGWMRRLARTEMLSLMFFTWAVFSGGFYVAALYFLLPLAFIFALYILFKSKMGLFSKLLNTFVPFLIGVALSSYKLIGVFKYQFNNPRSLNAVTVDFSHISEFFGFQFAPTNNFWWVFDFSSELPWRIWEYSNFNLIHIFAIVAFIQVARLRSVKTDGLLLAVTSYLVICVLLSLGDFSEFLPFALINKWILDNSARVPLRFQVGITFGLMLFSSIIFFRTAFKIKKGVVYAVTVLWLLNFGTFHKTLELDTFTYLAELRANNRKEMRELQLAPFSQRMYPTVLAGDGLLTCYQPLAREVRFSLKEGVQSRFRVRLSENCEQVYFTQNRIKDTENCSPVTCIFVNSLNEADKPHWNWNAEKEKYCLVKK